MCHLSHIQQEDLEEEAHSAACDLVGGSADGITQLVPKSETVPLDSLLEKRGDVSGDQPIRVQEHRRGAINKSENGEHDGA